MIKTFYCKFYHSKPFTYDKLLEYRQCKIQLIFLSYLSLIPSISMIAVAISNLVNLETINSKMLIMVDIERIAISSLIVFLIIMENSIRD